MTPARNPLRICLVYDCLYPWTVGGAEHWYRQFAEGLVAAGHEVTYLTRRQWGEDDAPRLPGIDVVAVDMGVTELNDEFVRIGTGDMGDHVCE